MCWYLAVKVAFVMVMTRCSRNGDDSRNGCGGDNGGASIMVDFNKPLQIFCARDAIIVLSFHVIYSTLR